MAKSTPNLGLYQYEQSDGNQTFNIDTALNDNWEKIDGAIGDASGVAQELAMHKSDNAKHGVVGTATGTNTLAMTSSDVTAYTDMMLVAFKNTTESTEATTLNINNLGAKAIVKANGNAVTNLKANAIYQVRYSGTSFILLGEGGEYGTATASDVLVGKTIGTEGGIVVGTATVGSLGGVKTATGEITISANGDYVTVSGLGFKPKTVILTYMTSNLNYIGITSYSSEMFKGSGDKVLMQSGFLAESNGGARQLLRALTANEVVAEGTFTLQVNYYFAGPVKWIAYE